MALGEPIKLRLSVEKQQQYEDEAAGRGMPLATYLRRRLEQGDELAEQITELRALIEDGFARVEGQGRTRPADAAAPAGIEPAILIEALLLLRSVVNEGKVGVVHGEMRRQGLPIWTGEKGGKK